MSIALLITPLCQKVPDIEHADYIGVDAGALKIIESNHPIKMAVGDFDSMSELDLQKLDCVVDKHPVMKDETDAELAMKLCKDYDEVILYGGLSGRIDHTIANIRLIMYQYNNVILMDEMQCIRVLKNGIHWINNDYKHISFYAIEESVISLYGFLYPLKKTRISVPDIYTTSNSLEKDQGEVVVHSGSVLCVQSNWR